MVNNQRKKTGYPAKKGNLRTRIMNHLRFLGWSSKSWYLPVDKNHAGTHVWDPQNGMHCVRLKAGFLVYWWWLAIKTDSYQHEPTSSNICIMGFGPNIRFRLVAWNVSPRRWYICSMIQTKPKPVSADAGDKSVKTHFFTDFHIRKPIICDHFLQIFRIFPTNSSGWGPPWAPCTGSPGAPRPCCTDLAPGSMLTSFSATSEGDGRSATGAAARGRRRGAARRWCRSDFFASRCRVFCCVCYPMEV